MSKYRSLNICLTDLPKERMYKSEKNGKIYISLSTYDYDEPDQYENDFSISLPLTKEERERKDKGETINRIFVGNGKIWKSGQTQPAQQDIDDLPF